MTEDFLTSMYLHDAGFRSKYVHEYLARGLSPDSLNDFMKQRLRWAAGEWDWERAATHDRHLRSSRAAEGGGGTSESMASSS